MFHLHNVFTISILQCRSLEGRKEMFYLTMHSTLFIYGYMASDIWLRTILIVKKETRCCHIGYSLRLTARVLLYAPSHKQDSTYHSLCYTSRGALAGMRNRSMGLPHEGSIRWPIAPWANALTTELHLAPPKFGTLMAKIYIYIYLLFHFLKDLTLIILFSLFVSRLVNESQIVVCTVLQT